MVHGFILTIVFTNKILLWQIFMMHTGQIPVSICSLGGGTIYFQNEQKLHTHSFH